MKDYLQRDSKDHYENFWGRMLDGIRARIECGERDPLTIVNQIEFERRDELITYDTSTRPAEVGYKRLAGLRLKQAAYNEVVVLPPSGGSADE